MPEPPAATARYDIVLLDLLKSPAQLGALRGRGLVAPGAVTAALYADHRISSAAELARRCQLWGVTAPADGLLLTCRDGQAARPQPPRDRTLVLGGARSGKSREAELRLAAEPQVTYVAAGPWPSPPEGADDGSGAGDCGGAGGAGGAEGAGHPGWAGDPDWASRVAAHRAGLRRVADGGEHRPGGHFG